ncbi:hypothetical protein [Microbispora sp. CA-102843]|uniref:hypothetical protein n=1 Tax=Microbispora sp. CA-102843 TaxID=3239952 RepID=UPI003D8D6FED
MGPFDLTGLSLPHYVPNAGIRLMTDGIVLAYTGDTGPTPVLAELGRDADRSSSRPPTATGDRGRHIGAGAIVKDVPSGSAERRMTHRRRLAR